MKVSLDKFLAQNPFPNPMTLGFFYREKMRAIHTVAPASAPRDVLEVGGGRSGLTAMLYPEASIVNLDFDASFARDPSNTRPNMRFVHGDATAVPFEDSSFDMVTMFDLLEHVPDDRAAVAEAVRVLRPGGYLLFSSPNEHWRYPYYSFLRPFCPPEEELFAEWGHVRRGYALDDLRALIPMRLEASAMFINPVTALAHDVAFSRLSVAARRRICRVLSPLTWAGYHLHRPSTRGTETASAWQK